MGKITNVMIKDHNTLIINQEAHPGDEIDLLSINQIDNSILIKAIKEGNDKEYNRLLTEAKKSLHNELEREFVEKVKFYEIELEKLKERQKQSEKENEIKVKLAVNIKEKELQEKKQNTISISEKNDDGKKKSVKCQCSGSKFPQPGVFDRHNVDGVCQRRKQNVDQPLNIDFAAAPRLAQYDDTCDRHDDSSESGKFQAFPVKEKHDQSHHDGVDKEDRRRNAGVHDPEGEKPEKTGQPQKDPGTDGVRQISEGEAETFFPQQQHTSHQNARK